MKRISSYQVWGTLVTDFTLSDTKISLNVSLSRVGIEFI